jgi:hypothetical protein
MSILRERANPKRQGDVGTAMAISWFMKHSYEIFMPLGDYPDCDLVVRIDARLCSIQVRTTYYKSPTGNYVVHLRVNGGNRSGAGKTKHFDPTRVAYVFAFAEDESMYLIPSYAIEARSALSMCGK